MTKREGYLEPGSRKKILLLSDDLRFPSGVGTMSKEIVLGTCHHYNWVQIGAGINHPDRGKILDLSKSAADETGVEDASVRIVPSDGYGNSQLLREVMRNEKPDAVMIFTDPSYWIWLFSMEREIRTKVPIMYLNIWDNPPYPMYNKPYYMSCDGLFGISKQTVNINKQVLGEEEVLNHVIRYIPHGVSSFYKPLLKNDAKLLEFKKNIFGENQPEFILFYNARNIGRKRTSDIILAWRYFCDTLSPDEVKKCCLYLHTDPVDNAGTDLLAVAEALCPSNYNIRFDGNRYSTEQMNLLYNMSDGVIMASAAEGWGLAITEALNTGKMFIATVTGGMQDQMRFEDENGNWIDFSKNFPSNHTGLYKKHGEWCIPVWPSSGRALVGSPLTPYIYDDRAPIEDYGKAILELYQMDSEERERRGRLGYEWATGPEAGFTSTQMANRFIEAADATLEHHSKHPRSRYEFMKVEGRPSTYVDYNPVTYSVSK